MESKEVTVTILDRNYRLRASGSEEQYLLAAAGLIDRQAREYGKRYGAGDRQDLLAMASLGPVAELQKMRAGQSVQDGDLLNRLSHINELLTQAI